MENLQEDQNYGGNLTAKNLAPPTNDGDASTKGYTDSAAALAESNANTYTNAQVAPLETKTQEITYTGGGTQIGVNGGKVGFMGASPSVAATVADASGGLIIDVQARSQLNALLAELRTKGLLRT